MLITRSLERISCATLVIGACLTATVQAQLRVANWNVTDYQSGRVADFQNAIFGATPAGTLVVGARFFPDVLIAEEIRDATGRTNFLNLLNTYPGGPTDWAATPFVATTVNPSSNPSHVLFYRTSKVDYLDTVVLTSGTGSCATCPPRDNHRYHIRLKNYPAGAPAELYLYAAHFKAGSAGSDQDRRTPEANRLRTDSNALPAGAHFILGADFNIQSSTQTAYQNLIVNGSNAAGRFIDPINTPGSWENNSAFNFVHTQEPATQMDSRHDQLLVSPTLRNSSGLEYIGSTSLAYSTSTWNDPNHSYRCWGNDGSTFNAPLKTSGNTMVGASIAQSLINSVNGNGHLPVYLDLRVPARISAPANIAFGQVTQNTTAQVTITIRNGEALVSGSDPHFARFGRDNTANGFETLSYTLSASSGFTAPSGTFTRTASSNAGNTHTITMNTSTVGTKTGTITIISNAAGVPSLVIPITGQVIAPAVTRCSPADIAYGDGEPLPPYGIAGGFNPGVDGGDFDCFFNSYFALAPDNAVCDIAYGDGEPLPPFGVAGGFNPGVDGGDFDCFFNYYFAPCP